MMFILRTEGAPPRDAVVKLQRRTPLPGATTRDYFCVGDPAALQAQGFQVVAVHDGWYADDSGGGVAIFGQGKFWEVRDTPFTVKEADSAIVQIDSGVTAEGDQLNVRDRIFGIA